VFRSPLVLGLLSLLLSLLASRPAPAASWAEGMFSGINRDFGTVPQGRQLVHLFPLTNNTGRTVTIGTVRSSCGCIHAQALQTNLSPGQVSAIQVEMDTRRFQGDKQSVVYVQFLRPAVAEARLHVRAHSRADILISPDGFAFGHVRQGSSPAVDVVVTLPGPGGKVEGTTATSDYVVLAVQRLRDEAGATHYLVTARLRADAPEGRWHGEVWLRTNQATAPWVRVPFTVVVTR
jgi:hypothetical protein